MKKSCKNSRFLVLINSFFVCLFMFCFVLFFFLKFFCFFIHAISILGFLYVNTQYMLPIAHIYIYSFVYFFFLQLLYLYFSFMIFLLSFSLLCPFFDCAYFDKVGTRTIFVCLFCLLVVFNFN
jgi:hypothetical protein